MKPHHRLTVWKNSMNLVVCIYSETENFPKQEQFGITSQLRRAVVTIASNMAEGAARHTYKEFLHFLFIARGSLSEVDTLLIISLRLKYLSKETYGQLNAELEIISKLLDGLIKSLKQKVF